ncbi:DUF1461 domain-containing protein [Candidatus Woesearchaeota archaeon]|nr:DUF1461 domain-containing protein [Candidatus Woesearchaeota archaeon]
MGKRHHDRQSRGILLPILLSVLVLLSIVRFVGFTSFIYEIEHARLEGDPEIVLNENASIIAGQVLDYLKSDDEVLDPEVFGEKELAHMHDVKNLFNLLQTAIIVLAVLCGLMIFVATGKHNFHFRRILHRTGIFMILFALAFILLSINFSWFFTKFHLLSFNNDFWLLPADSALITTFPQLFFQHMFTYILLVYMVIGMMFFIFRSVSRPQSNYPHKVFFRK